MHTLRYPYIARQRGAIAAMTGFLLLFVLCAVGGLSLDLGRLYIVKSELQNIADAAALAAAKDLDNSPAGVLAAYNSGVALAAKNKYNFNTTLTLTQANFRFADSPDGPWYSYTDTYSNPSGRTFVEIDTRIGGNGGTNQSIGTYLMSVAGITSMSTLGYAVAGRYVNSVTPIGICAIDPTRRTANYDYGAFTELVEFGFRRGMAYNVFALGTLGSASSDPYLINPVNAPPNTCDSNNSSTNKTAPFMCSGNSAVLPLGTGTVYANTGVSATLDVALNSRFNYFPNSSQCDPATAPPDVNVREYPCHGNSGPCVKNAANSMSATPPMDWMDSTAGDYTYPNQQDVSVTSTQPYTPNYALPHEANAVDSSKIWPSTVGASSRVTTQATYPQHGILWAYTPPVQSNGTTLITPAQANGTIGTNTPGTDKLMYGPKGGATDYIDASKYPATAGSGFPAGTVAAPYNQSGNPNYYQSPTGRTGQIDRRILNLVLINCAATPVGSGACAKMPAVGIGKFFMLTQADFSGSPKKLFVEFTGLVEPVPTAEVKLYK